MGESKSRGELAEIRTTLAALASAGGSSKAETAVTAKRDVFKKIINYITIGIDMSSLFMQVQQRMVSCRNANVLLVHQVRAMRCLCRDMPVLNGGEFLMSTIGRSAETLVVHCR